MNESTLLWLLGILIAVTLSQAGALYQHVKECKDAAKDRARIEGLCDAIKEELAAARRWRDESFPTRIDTILSDFYGDRANYREQIERRIAKAEHDIERLQEKR